ncbi:MAG: copper resistance protein NlpE [Spirochaetales bacterium]|jgi:uncharacterized lipoprotein NlpE involved in copper resistance|nr:copper resistance protein NlpE [Spirochaetales bacterium]
MKITNRKKIVLLTAVILTLAFFSCVSTAAPSSIEGSYSGILPCADCEGIQTRIRLEGNGTYILQARYLGKSTELFEEAGRFTINSQNILTLEGLDGKPALPRYVVGADTLTQLDMEGNPITGSLADNYILKRE